MALPKALRTLNLGNILLLVGLCALAASLWLPYATASRTKRIETRALDTVVQLADLVKKEPNLNLQDQQAYSRIGQALNKALGVSDQKSSLYVHMEEPLNGLHGQSFLFKDKHFLYLVLQAPPEEEKDEEGDEGEDNPDKSPTTVHETYAWPSSRLGSSRTTFYFNTTGMAAFSRNLDGDYLGRKKRPKPGGGTANDKIQDSGGEQWYRGKDDNRWIVLK